MAKAKKTFEPMGPIDGEITYGQRGGNETDSGGGEGGQAIPHRPAASPTPAVSRRGRRAATSFTPTSFTPTPTSRYNSDICTFEEFQRGLPRQRAPRKITPAQPLPRHPQHERILLEATDGFEFCLRWSCRRDTARLKMDKISWYENCLGLDFQSELDKLSPRYENYLRAIATYDPAVRQQRLDRIEQTRQAIIDEPTAETLREYQTALKAKPTPEEKIIYDAIENLGLTEIEVNQDVEIVAEFRNLREQINTFDEFEKSWRSFQKTVEASAVRLGLNHLKDVGHQNLLLENQRLSDEYRRLQKCQKRFSQLQNLEIIKNIKD